MDWSKIKLKWKGKLEEQRSNKKDKENILEEMTEWIVKRREKERKKDDNFGRVGWKKRKKRRKNIEKREVEYNDGKPGKRMKWKTKKKAYKLREKEVEKGWK